MKDKRFEYYDSLSTKPDRRAFVVSCCQAGLTWSDPSFRQVMREYLQKEHMDKKKTPIDLSDWEDYWDPVSCVPGVPDVLLKVFPAGRKDRNNSMARTAVYLPVRPLSIELEVSGTRETT